MNLGMAFQIVDDVLDYTATERELGKPVGSDLRHGTVTLPALHYLRAHPHDPRVLGLLDQDEDALAEAVAAVDAIRRSGAVEQALARAAVYAREATDHLADLPPDPYVDALRGLARYVVERHE
jgi:geranylgeranyl pyrophosphate synthase